MKFLFLLISCVALGQTAFVPTTQLCPSGQQFVGVPTSSVGTYSLITLKCQLIVSNCATPNWQVETISFTSIPIDSTIYSYTTLKTPVSGIINYWYDSSNIPTSKTGVISYTSQPISILLPTNWAPTDTLTISYQIQ